MPPLKKAVASKSTVVGSGKKAKEEVVVKENIKKSGNKDKSNRKTANNSPKPRAGSAAKDKKSIGIRTNGINQKKKVEEKNDSKGRRPSSPPTKKVSRGKREASASEYEEEEGEEEQEEEMIDDEDEDEEEEVDDEGEKTSEDEEIKKKEEKLKRNQRAKQRATKGRPSGKMTRMQKSSSEKEETEEEGEYHSSSEEERHNKQQRGKHAKSKQAKPAKQVSKSKGVSKARGAEVESDIPETSNDEEDKRKKKKAAKPIKVPVTNKRTTKKAQEEEESEYQETGTEGSERDDSEDVEKDEPKKKERSRAINSKASKVNVEVTVKKSTVRQTEMKNPAPSATTKAKRSREQYTPEREENEGEEQEDGMEIITPKPKKPKVDRDFHQIIDERDMEDSPALEVLKTNTLHSSVLKEFAKLKDSFAAFEAMLKASTLRQDNEETEPERGAVNGLVRGASINGEETAMELVMSHTDDNAGEQSHVSAGSDKGGGEDQSSLFDEGAEKTGEPNTSTEKDVKGGVVVGNAEEGNKVGEQRSSPYELSNVDEEITA